MVAKEISQTMTNLNKKQVQQHHTKTSPPPHTETNASAQEERQGANLCNLEKKQQLRTRQLLVCNAVQAQAVHGCVSNLCIQGLNAREHQAVEKRCQGGPASRGANLLQGKAKHVELGKHTLWRKGSKPSTCASSICIHVIVIITTFSTIACIDNVLNCVCKQLQHVCTCWVELAKQLEAALNHRPFKLKPMVHNH